MRLLQIHRPPRQAVGRHHLESVGILEISVEVEGKQLVRKLIVEQLAVEDATLRYQMADANILITRKIVDIGDTGTTRLATHIRHAIAGTSRHRHHVWEV